MFFAQPKYVATLPSSGKKIEYRPYVTKEEKSLLLALEDGDPYMILNAVKNIVTACTFEKFDVDTEPYFDLEYMFLMIRAKAVGEHVEMIGKCECSPEARTNFHVDITHNKIENLKDPKALIIHVTENDGVIMKYPTITDVFEATVETPEDETQAIMMAAKYINSIFTTDEVYEAADLDLTKKLEFINELTPLQRQPIADFIATPTRLVVPAEYNCEACGKHHKVTLSGLENFFV